jgi:hypothetical protein
MKKKTFKILPPKALVTEAFLAKGAQEIDPTTRKTYLLPQMSAGP